MTAAELDALHNAYPSTWARDCLGFEPDEAQTAFLDCTRPDQLVLWARQIGKSECCGIKLAHFALYHAGSLSLVVSASQRQSAIVQGRVIGAMRRLNIGLKTQVLREVEMPEDLLDPDSRIIRASVLSMLLANGSSVISCPASADTVRGYAPDLIVVDESARVPNAVFVAISPMRAVAAKRVTLILASTAAFKQGRFYEAWTSKDSSWWRSMVTAKQCPRISPEFLARERRNMVARDYEAEYECVFQELSGAVFPAWMLEKIISADVKPLFPRHPSDSMISEDVQPLFAGGTR